MTKKHFQGIADVIREIEDPAERVRTANRMARHLQQYNERFDRNRFVEACTKTK